MVLNLVNVTTENGWKGTVRAKNLNDASDTEYVVDRNDSKDGAMWLSRDYRYPVQFHFNGTLPNGKDCDGNIFEIWDDGNYNIACQFVSGSTVFKRHVDHSRAFKVIFDGNDGIMFEVAEGDSSFDSDGNKTWRIDNASSKCLLDYHS